MTAAAGETIFALSSGAPPAAIGVIRVSGAAAAAALVAIAGRVPPPRRAHYAAFRDVDGELLDRGLALWFPGPGTATGEDLAEFHIHGGRAVADAMLRALARVPGTRAALPGEFTRRAFVNGVIDLAEAEGLADLLSAETDLQRRAALAGAGGALSRRVEAWRETVLSLSAQVEAMLDFADEGDVTVDEAQFHAGVAAVAAEMAAMLARPLAERLRDGVRVVLAGPPNAGKSTLLNTLVGRDAAIVSSIAGTTRDVIEAPVALDGIPFLFSDTAGLRESDDPIERAGVDRARMTLSEADIVLWLGDPATPPMETAVILLHACCDVRPAHVSSGLAVSAVTGEGIAELTRLLIARARTLLPRIDEVTLNRRQHDALQQCVVSLCSIETGMNPLFSAEFLREARDALDRIAGRAGVEDMLDALFGRFCIGK